MLLKPDSRIVFFGDSLTQQTSVINSALPRKKFGPCFSGSYVDVLLKRLLVNFPGYKFLAWNRGASGNDVPDLLARVEQDVMALEPTIVVLFVGMNDAKQYDAAVFEANLRKLTGILASKGASIIHLSTTVHIADGKRTALLDTYDPIIRRIAEEQGNAYVDLKSRMNQVIASNAGETKAIINLFSDGAHLSELGNILVADAVYEALTR